VKKQDTHAALLEACHRALDDLRRLDPLPIVGVSGEDDQAARGDCLLSRWRSGEAGNEEERCFLVRVA
jgi:hypothetical protein